MKRDLTIKILLVILILASAVRIFRLDTVPPSISWDEAAVGYNGWTIANYGRDEYGKFFPLSFKSFGDDKHPVHIYATAFLVKLFGLSDFTTRLPVAIFGIINVLLIFFSGKLLFKNEWIGIIAATFLAISPYHIQFSRFNHELNFALFFFLLGLISFMKSLEGKKWLLIVSFFSFGLDLLSYHSAKVVVPPLILILIILYAKNLWVMKGYFLTSLVIILLFLTIIILNPALLGIARAKQTSFSDGEIKNTVIFQKTQNYLLGCGEIVSKNYLTHFNPRYLFLTGGENGKFSTQEMGEFYRIEALFLLVGFFILVLKRSKVSVILLSWALLAPIPSSLTNEAPHAARALYMLGSWNIISAYGFYQVIRAVKLRNIKFVFISIVTIVLLVSFITYLHYYFRIYPQQNAIDWQYGMRQIVEYVRDNPHYTHVYITDIRFQPYIFFLFYLKTPLSEYLNTVYYNNSESKSYSLVSFYDKYFFGGWDTVESMPNKDVLYVLTPSEYDGLRLRSEFGLMKLVQFPNGANAFYLVSKN